MDVVKAAIYSAILSTNMQLFKLLIVFIIVDSDDCKLVKSGIFDNVTVLVKGLDKTGIEDVILIDFDDNLAKYVNESEVIIIKNQFIPKLDTDSISDLPKTQILSLVSNGIREIRRGTFNNLPKLKLLNLSHNEIEDIHQGIFNDLQIEDLYLNDNKISRIGYKAFSHLNLKRLNLSKNRISRWSKDWFSESFVRVLDLSFNLIQDLPPNSFNMMSKSINDSISLIFTGNHLKKITNNVFDAFENFKIISLDSNLIDRLDTGVFNGVKHINTLNLNNNSLTEISADVFRNTEITILMVEDNKLRCLSTDIFRMEELDIDGNPISCFCVKTWLDWREHHSNPSIYHITNLEQECI